MSASACELLLMVLAAELTPHQADAFIDHVIIGMSHREIAAECGVSGSAVDQLIRRARRRMQAVVLAAAA